MADIQENFNRLQSELQHRSLTTTIVESGMATIVLLVALLGNILVCRAVYRCPRLRTITNYSVVVLALTDISMALFVMPLVLSVSILGERPFGHLICQVQAYIAIALVYSSIFTVTFMSVNRYFKIVKTNLYRRVFTHKKTLLMLFVILIVAWFGPVPLLLRGQGFRFHPGKVVCSYSHDKQLSKAINIILTVVYFILPYCVTIFCYCNIYYTVHSHNKRIGNAAPSTCNNTTTINRKDIYIAKTLFAIFLVFTLCMMQITVIDNIELGKGGYKLPRQVYVLYSTMCGLASAVNPFIYGIFNPAFRSEYKRSLCLK